MTRVVVLDAGPLGLVTNPKETPQNLACSQWLGSLLDRGIKVIVPEIADYEVRRELLRANKSQGIERLDALAKIVDYLPLTTAAMRRAAALWAHVRQKGKPTADDKNIDGDVILAGQIADLKIDDFVIATTNLRHLSRFAPTDFWHNIGSSQSRPPC